MILVLYGKTFDVTCHLPDEICQQRFITVFVYFE